MLQIHPPLLPFVRSFDLTQTKTKNSSEPGFSLRTRKAARTGMGFRSRKGKYQTRERGAGYPKGRPAFRSASWASAVRSSRGRQDPALR